MRYLTIMRGNAMRSSASERRSDDCRSSGNDESLLKLRAFHGVKEGRGLQHFSVRASVRNA